MIESQSRAALSATAALGGTHFAWLVDCSFRRPLLARTGLGAGTVHGVDGRVAAAVLVNVLGTHCEVVVECEEEATLK